MDGLICGVYKQPISRVAVQLKTPMIAVVEVEVILILLSLSGGREESVSKIN